MNDEEVDDRCVTRCDHDSRCTLPAGHTPADRHETEHGCICYDPRVVLAPEAALGAVKLLLEKNGCDCDCAHDAESHDPDCDRCLACRISWAIES